MDYVQTKLVPRYRARCARQTGFTFIEVTVALALLAVAASILIGMQGAAVRRTIRDANAQSAMLVARRIMASVELLKDSEFMLATQTNGPVRELLQQLNITELGSRAESSAIDQMTASVTVDELEIEWLVVPKKEKMKRIVLRLTWGPGPDESMQLVYQRAPVP
jgi:prepilin-type N-terminal cleavage/methylation domain-containing protein